MSSEWEELESWLKEDLVIETVRFRSRLHSTCNLLRSLADDKGDAFLYDEGSEPSKKWLDRIVERIMSLKEPGRDWNVRNWRSTGSMRGLPKSVSMEGHYSRMTIIL